MSKVEVTFRIIELSISFIGLVFVVFGWIIPYKQSIGLKEKENEYEKEFQKNIWKKELIDKQIAQFYGPIASLLREDNIRFHFVLDEMGRMHVFEDGNHKLSDLSEDDQKRWKHYVNTYKIPTQNKILEIIECNKHLVYKSEIPTSFDRFMSYSLGWELLDNQFKNNVPNYYEYYFCYNFPYDFIIYINETLDLLLKIQSELTGLTEYSTTAY